MRKHGRQATRATARLLLFSFLLTIIPAAASHGNPELVTCKYLKSSGNEIQLEVRVGSPPPASLIITQNIPAGIDILSSSPEINKFNKKQGEAKWLLKGISPGSLILSLNLSPPIGPGQISGELRYKNPIDGSMVQMPIRP